MSKSSSTKTTVEVVKKPNISSNSSSNKFLDRQQMISDAAYFIAEKRNFVEGDPNEDWFSAEVQIEAIIKNTKSSTKKNNRKKNT
jgi:hypothetical protein